MNTEPEATARAAATDEVVLAMLPGLLALVVCFGWGTVVNLLWALPVVLAAQALAALPGEHALWLSARSALPGALVLAVALPPAAPFWLVGGAAVLAASLRRAIRTSRFPPFNPAMAAIALALLLFPREAAHWIAPAGAAPLPTDPLGLMEALRAATGGSGQLDAFTMATPLELLRHDNSHTMAELRALHPQFGAWGGQGWEWANAAFLAGGLWLAWRRIVPWQASAGFIAALVVAAALYNDGGSSASAGSPLLHLFSGGTLFAAFFVVTEPAGGARGPRGRFAFGMLAGAVVFALRQNGAFADGIAFAVLFANGLVPLLDSMDFRASALPSVPMQGSRRRLLQLAGAALGLAALLGGWHGTAQPPRTVQTDNLSTLLREASGTANSEAPPAFEAFDLQDELLLGHATPQQAYRLRSAGHTTAVILPVRAAQGYAGPIELLVGVDREGALTGVRVIAHSETPGIGDVIEAGRGGWIERFGSPRGGTPDGLSGATVSTRAVRDSVARAVRFFEINRVMLLGDVAGAAPPAGPAQP